MSLRKGASVQRRKRRANGEQILVNPPGIPLHVGEVQIQPGSIPVNNPANDLEPRWLGRQGPLVYRTSNFVSEFGENPKQVVNSFIKSGVKKVRINSCQFLVSFYKLRTDQVLSYTTNDPSNGVQNRSITIPAGNYSKRELQSYFQRELLVGRLQFYTDNGNRTVFYILPESGGPQFTSFLINFTNAQDLKNALGYRPDPDIFVGQVSQEIFKSNGVATTGAKAVSTNHINLALPNAIHICSPNIHSLMRSRSLDMSTDQEQAQFIATVPITVNSGQYVYWQNANGEFYDCYGSGDFLFDNIGFCYNDGTAVDFKGAPWSIEVGYLIDDAGQLAGDITT